MAEIYGLEMGAEAKLTGMISRFAVALGKFISGACDRWCLRRFRLAHSKKIAIEFFNCQDPNTLRTGKFPLYTLLFFHLNAGDGTCLTDYVPILLHGRLGVKKFDEHIFQMGGSTTNYHGNPRFLHFLGYNPYFGGVKPSFFMGTWGPRVG